jgi:hypothetical protein
MSEYFSNFPKIRYDIHGTNSIRPDYTIGTNLLIRQKLKDAVKKDVSVYYPYVIPDNITRADILSQMIYGDTKFTWTIFLVNNILDPVWEWPMTTPIFQKHLENKYGSVAIAKTTIHHYEYVWSERVEATGTSDPIPEQFLEVDYDSYLATNPDLRRTIYAYEYEDKLNEGHREIQLIQPAFATKVLTESRKIFR